MCSGFYGSLTWASYVECHYIYVTNVPVYSTYYEDGGYSVVFLGIKASQTDNKGSVLEQIRR